MQLSKPKERYLWAVDKALDETQRPIGQRIVNAMFDRTLVPLPEDQQTDQQKYREVWKVGDLLPAQDSDFGFMIELVASWRTMIGCAQEIDPQLLRAEAIYLMQSHPEISIAELKTAIHLLSQSKLPINLPYVINFSCLFMSQVVHAYQTLKKTLMAPVIEADEKKLSAPVVSIQERVDSMKYMIIEVKKQIDNGSDHNMFFSDVYNFLRKTKRLKFPQELVDNAKKYTDKHYAAWAQRQTLALNKSGKERNEERDFMRRQIAIGYCLTEYFKTNDVQKVADSITAAEYEKYLKEQDKKQKQLH